jgi:ATP-binding cassette subfamily F protein uup
MNYFSVNNLSKSFGETHLFQNFSFGIQSREKVGLIAKNGAGKSTFLEILKGNLLQDSGEFAFKDGIVISYLDQAPVIEPGLTIKQFIYQSGNADIDRLKRYDALIQKGDTESDRFMQLMDEIDVNNSWDVEVRINEICENLGFSNLDLVVDDFSGGQKRRLALARCLIEAPDLLFLDEPTNHLDFNMIEWLESYLADSALTFLLITHDRYFLDNVCNRIIELTGEGSYSYDGNYEYYLQKKAERDEQELSTIQKAKNLYKTELQWLRRMPKARGTKSKSRIQAASELEKVAKKSVKADSVDIDTGMQRLGKKVIELYGLTKSFGDKLMLDDFNYNFQRSEKIGIVGGNGVGKSTFLNVLAGKDDDYTGTIEIGQTIKIGYYTQKGLSFRPDMKVIDVVKDIAEVIELKSGNKITASQMLEKFNFSPKKQHTYIEKLSGGEKKRLYLVQVLMAQPNFLILDEPTNDLDVFTLGALEDYLINFKGCVLIVSHDRYFLDRIVDHLFVFEGAGKVSVFPGSYTQFRAFEKSRLATSEKMEATKVEKIEESTEKNLPEERKITFKEKQELELLENEILNLEEQKSILEERLSVESGEKINEISIELSSVIEKLETKETRWAELAELKGA